MNQPLQNGLSKDAVRRLLISLIETAQDPLLRDGVIGPDLALTSMQAQEPQSAIDTLAIDEHSLGFDSLARLELVLTVNRFFQLHTTGIEDYLLVRRSVGEWVGLVLQHLDMRCDQNQIAFQTSGSTGQPKTVLHDLKVLQAEVRALHDDVLPPLNETNRVFALVPPHHIYGFLFTCLLPSMTGAQTTSLYRHSPLRAIAEARAGDLVIATPFIWAKLVQSGLRFAPGVAGVTSAGPSDTATWSAPGRTGLDTLTEIYGATETGGIGYRHAMQDHFTLLPHLTQTDAGVASIDNANEVHTVQDRLSWIDDRRFDILGRLDDVIQIAGVNVSPHHICQTIKAVDGVAEADVRFDGQKLRARVVPESANDNADDILARIRTHLNQQLDPPGRPSQIAICAALPRNAMGKCVDHP